LALRDILFSVGFEKITPEAFKSLQAQVSKKKLKIPVMFDVATIQNQLKVHTFRINVQLSPASLGGIAGQIQSAVRVGRGASVGKGEGVSIRSALTPLKPVGLHIPFSLYKRGGFIQPDAQSNFIPFRQLLNTKYYSPSPFGLGKPFNYTPEKKLSYLKQTAPYTRFSSVLNTSFPKDIPPNVQKNLLNTFAGQKLSSIFSIPEKDKESLFKIMGSLAKWAIGWTLLYGAVRSVMGEFGKGVKTIIDVDDAMVQLSRTIQIIPGDSISGVLKNLKEDAISLTTKYGESITDIIGIQQNWALQGKNVVEIQDLTRATILATEAAFLSSTDAAKFLTATIQQFNLHSSRAIEVVDVLNNVSKRYAVTARDLGEGMARAGASAKAVGLDFQELAGIIATVQQATQLGGAVVGTQVKTLLLRFTQPSRREKLTELTSVGNLPGIPTVTGNNELRSPLVILGEIANRYDKLSSAQQANINVTLAGVRQSAVLLNILNNFPTLLASIGDAYSSAGSAADDARKRMESLKKQFSLIRAELEKMALGVDEGGGGGVLLSIAQNMRALVVGVDAFKNSIWDFIKVLGGLYLAFKLIAPFVIGLIAFFETASITGGTGMLALGAGITAFGSALLPVIIIVAGLTAGWLLLRKAMSKGEEIIQAREHLTEFSDAAKKAKREIDNLSERTKYGQTLADYFERKIGQRGMGTPEQQKRIEEDITKTKETFIKFFQLERDTADVLLNNAKKKLEVDKEILKVKKEQIQVEIKRIEDLLATPIAKRPVSDKEFQAMRSRVVKGIGAMNLSAFSTEEIDKETRRRIIEQRVLNRRETTTDLNAALRAYRGEISSQDIEGEGVLYKESYTAVEEYRNALSKLISIYKITSGIIGEYNAKQMLLNAQVSLAQNRVEELLETKIKLNDADLQGSDMLEELQKQYGSATQNEKNLKNATNDLSEATKRLNEFKKEQSMREAEIRRVGLRGGGTIETLIKQLELAETEEEKIKTRIQMRDEELKQGRELQDISSDNVLAQADALGVNEKQLFILKERIINERYITDEYRRQVELTKLANEQVNTTIARQSALREDILGVGQSTFKELREGKNIGVTAKGFLGDIQDKIFGNISRNIFGGFAQKIAERLDAVLQNTDQFNPMQNAIINAHVVGIQRGFASMYGGGSAGRPGIGVVGAGRPGIGVVGAGINNIVGNAPPSQGQFMGYNTADAWGGGFAIPGVDTRATALIPQDEMPGAGISPQINGTPANAVPTMFSRLGGWAGIGMSAGMGAGMVGGLIGNGASRGSLRGGIGNVLTGAGSGLGLASMFGATAPLFASSGFAAGGAANIAGATTGGVGAGTLGLGAAGGIGLGLAPTLGAKYGRIAGAASGAIGGAMLGTAISPGIGTLIGTLAGGVYGALFGKEKSKSETNETVEKSIRQSLDSKINITNSTLKLINRNMEALRGAPELYPMPKSFYFRQRAGGGSGVNVQVNIGNEAIDDRFVNVVSRNLNTNMQRGATEF